MLKIRITHLKPGIHEYSLDPTPEELDLDSELFSNIHVDVRLDYSGDRVLASFETTATAVLECDRTLVLFEQPVNGSYTLLYVPPDMVSASGEEIEEVRVLQPTDNEIDLTQPVRDTILLSIPARRIAPGAEDLEIQTTFGASEEQEEDEVDPRWEALRKLRSNDNS